MIEIAPDVHRIPLLPRDGVNAYLVGDVLVDSGVAKSAKGVLAAIDGRTIRAHAITHAHADHIGGSPQITDQLRVPFWAGAGDAPAARTGDQVVKPGPLKGVLGFVGSFDGLDVDRELHAGDELAAGFVVVDAPGHSPGQVAFWRESDRVLIAGDVWTNMSLLTTVVGLHQPPAVLTVDPARNRRSIRELTALSPAVVCFGHGPELRDAGPKLRAFADALPA